MIEFLFLPGCFVTVCETVGPMDSRRLEESSWKSPERVDGEERAEEKKGPLP